MIRVIYRWRVRPGRHAEFIPWWHAGTLRIRESEPGALGSTLCQSSEDREVFVGIARWEERQHVEAFWKRAGNVGFEGAVLESMEVIDELDDLTLGGG